MTEAKLLLDEQIIGSKEYFKVLGWEVTDVDKVGLRNTSDDVIVEFARNKNYIIITKDVKMGKKCDLASVKNFVISDDWIAKNVDKELRCRLK